MRLLDIASAVWGLAAVWTPPASQPAGATGLLPPELRQWMDDARTRWGVRGTSIAVVRAPQGDPAAAGGKNGTWAAEVVSLGEADDKGNKVTDESLFGIASNSKLFTALAIGMLVDNHTRLPGPGVAELAWETKVKDILPPDVWRLQDAYASDHVDLMDLAAMRSGMPAHDLMNRDGPEIDMVRALRHLRPTSEIRQTWQYNNMHYYVLAHIVHVLSGMPLQEYVQTHILGPLGMTRTTYDRRVAERWGGLVSGFTHVGQNHSRCAAESHGVYNASRACRGATEAVGWWSDGDGTGQAGAGGVISCTKDLTVWIRELLAPQVISAKLLAALSTPIMFDGVAAPGPGASAEAYGRGQFAAAYRGHDLAWHTGGYPGQTSLVLRAPAAGVAVAVVTNDENALAFFYAVAYRVLDTLLGLAPLDWEETFFAQLLADVPTRQPRADVPPPRDITDNYYDTGYGELNVSRVEQGPLRDVVEEQFALAGLPTDQPVYAAPFKRLFSTHLVFTHKNASEWHVAVLKTYEVGAHTRQGSDSAPDGARAERRLLAAAFRAFTCVVTREGIGMFNRFSVPGPLYHGHAPSEEDVARRAEVWFARVAA